MQRILVELVGAGEQLVEQRILALHVTDEQGLGELVLVLEMIEEAALGDADRGDHLLDRGGSEALLEHGSFRHVENALACIAALARRLLHAFLLSVPTVPRVHLKAGCGGTVADIRHRQNENPLKSRQFRIRTGVHRKSPGRRSEESSPY